MCGLAFTWSCDRMVSLTKGTAGVKRKEVYLPGIQFVYSDTDDYSDNDAILEERMRMYGAFCHAPSHHLVIII